VDFINDYFGNRNRDCQADIVAGATVTETGIGAVRTSEVRDIHDVPNPLNRHGFLRLQASMGP
jgi:hypothetical protein